MVKLSDVSGNYNYNFDQYCIEIVKNSKKRKSNVRGIGFNSILQKNEENIFKISNSFYFTWSEQAVPLSNFLFIRQSYE